MFVQGSTIEEPSSWKVFRNLNNGKGKLKNNKEEEAIITSTCQFMKPLRHIPLRYALKDLIYFFGKYPKRFTNENWKIFFIWLQGFHGVRVHLPFMSICNNGLT
jgi:hypothetical protein